eukprot:6448029-Prymnesium_polylepis.1
MTRRPVLQANTAASNPFGAPAAPASAFGGSPFGAPAATNVFGAAPAPAPSAPSRSADCWNAGAPQLAARLLRPSGALRHLRLGARQPRECQTANRKESSAIPLPVLKSAMSPRHVRRFARRAFGSPPAPVFGGGGATAPAFGAPSALGGAATTPAFGAPSALGAGAT